ncbi:DUF6270 domain-containing protein [Priestia megaterium]
MIKVLILGSCVTRDTFSFFPDQFTVVDYFARSSIISIMSEPLIINESELSLPSAFQRKMILYDFHKVFLNQILQCEFDLLIIDIIDERFDLLKYNNHYITRSSELVNSKIEQSEKYSFDVVKRDSKEVYELWKLNCNAFFRYILNHIPADKVILNKVFWSYKYRDEEKLYSFSVEEAKLIETHNKILKSYYSIIESQFPQINLINYSAEDFIADKNHKWGISPFHYELRHYSDCKNKIKNIWMKN